MQLRNYLSLNPNFIKLLFYIISKLLFIKYLHKKVNTQTKTTMHSVYLKNIFPNQNIHFY
jgi:hypothetical protein